MKSETNSEQRSTRAIAGFTAGAMGQLVQLLVGMASIPFLLKWLGQERFGLFRTSIDWLGYLEFFEFGLGSALIPLLIRSETHDQDLGTPQVLSVGLRAHAIAVVCTMAAGFGLSWYLPALLKIQGTTPSEVRWALIVGVCGTLPLMTGPFRAFLESRQRLYRLHLMLLSQSLMITFLSLSFAYFGLGLVGQFSAYLVGGWLFAFLLIKEVVEHRPKLLSEIARANPKREIWQSLMNLSWPALILKICGRISFVSDSIVLGILLTPSQVASWYLTQKVPQLVLGQLTSFGSASWAGLAQLHVQGKHQEFSERIFEITGLISSFGLALLIPVAILNSNFVELWVGLNSFAGTGVTLLASINVLLLGLFSFWGYCLSGVGKIRVQAPASIASAVVNLVASVLLTWKFGVVGPLLGTGISFLVIDSWYFPRALSRHFGISPAGLYRPVIQSVLLGGVVAVLALLLKRVLAPSSWILLIFEGGVGALTYLAGWWLLLQNRSQRALWIARGKSFLERFGILAI